MYQIVLRYNINDTFITGFAFYIRITHPFGKNILKMSNNSVAKTKRLLFFENDKAIAVLTKIHFYK